MVVFFSLYTPAFRSSLNLVSILSNAAIYIVLAVGETFVIIMAGIDLSIGSVLVFSGVLAAKVMGASAGATAGGVNAGWGTRHPGDRRRTRLGRSVGRPLTVCWSPEPRSRH